MTASSAGVSVEVAGLRHAYRKGGASIDVLRDVDASVGAGERVAILGPSGSGKSTLMNLLGLLDRPDAGAIRLAGVDATALDEPARDRLRNRRIGFVFQSHNLLPEQTALGNVAVPVRLAGGRASVAAVRAEAVLRAVGLGHRLHHRPTELSGGEQQRVAIARALVMGPGLLLADEPTGNLDPATAGGVFELLLSLHEALGTTLVVVTHSLELAARFPRRLRLSGARLVEA